MSDLYTSSYHAIGNHGRMFGCISYKYDVTDNYYRIYIYWLGEGLTQDTQWTDYYHLDTSATIVGAIKKGSTTLRSWSANASGTRGANVNNSGYSWFKAGGSDANYYDVTRTTSAQTITIQVTYTVSGYSALTGTTTITVPAKPITYTDATVADNGTVNLTDEMTATLKWKGTNGTNNNITGYSVVFNDRTIYTGTGTSTTVSLPNWYDNIFTVYAYAPQNTAHVNISINRPQKILMEPCAWVRVSGEWQPILRMYAMIAEWKQLESNNPYYINIGGTWEDIY